MSVGFVKFSVPFCELSTCHEPAYKKQGGVWKCDKHIQSHDPKLFKSRDHEIETLLKYALKAYIHQNITGWEVPICDLCDNYTDGDEHTNCPVALAVKLRDMLP